ncbi:MAG TPA: GntR family transcriptional regulator [Chloroflexota bacterium]|nr:GntR family transcriptional regulator [Chloroflexota bacterium]
MIEGRGTSIIQPEALWQRVVYAMRRAIVIGELEPGTHLKEPALAQHFGVSRLPVREAIAQLEREGLVRSEPRRGAFVVGVTEQAISDIYECRLLLETCALRRAAERIDEQGVAALAALIDRMDTGVAAGQVQVVAASDMAFHRLIIDLSGSRALVTAWEPLTPLIETALGIAEATVPDLPTAVGGHRGILFALQQRDGDEAARLMSEHLPGGEKLVLEAIRRVREGRQSA